MRDRPAFGSDHHFTIAPAAACRIKGSDYLKFLPKPRTMPWFKIPVEISHPAVPSVERDRTYLGFTTRSRRHQARHLLPQEILRTQRFQYLLRFSGRDEKLLLKPSKRKKRFPLGYPDTTILGENHSEDNDQETRTRIPGEAARTPVRNSREDRQYTHQIGPRRLYAGQPMLIMISNNVFHLGHVSSTNATVVFARSLPAMPCSNSVAGHPSDLPAHRQVRIG